MQDNATQPNSQPPVAQDQNATQVEPSVEWSASEFIQNDKSAGWFLMLALAALILGVVIYFAAGLISSIVVALAIFVLGFVGSRPPRTLTYKLDGGGIHIGDKSYAYEEFRSFSVIDEGAIDSIQLTPMKKYLPPISIYFTPEDGTKIVEILSEMLPHEDRKQDAVDRLMKRIRF